MSAKDPKALERRFLEELNKGKAAAMSIIDETCATKCFFTAAFPEQMLMLRKYR